MKKWLYYACQEQYNNDEQPVYQGGSYYDAIKALSSIYKGYVIASNCTDDDIRYTSDDTTCVIIKTKGWE